MSDRGDMPFLEHLEELRWRLVRSAIAMLVFAIGIFIFSDWITDNVFIAMKFKDFVTYEWFCALDMCLEEDLPVMPQSSSTTGQFGLAMTMSIIGGIVLAFPYIFYQFWLFLKPALKNNESKAFRGVTLYVSLLFFLGILFGYFILSPLCIQFFGQFSLSDSIENRWTVSSMIGTIVSTTFYTGLLFLLPVIIFFLSKIGLLSSAFLKKYRKHAFVVVLILSAIITPPDVISQVIVSIPVMGLYEVGIVVAKRVEAKRDQADLVRK